MTETAPQGRPGTLREALRRARARESANLFEALSAPLAEFLDDFYLDPDDASRLARIAEEPELSGHPFTDAYIGAVGEHLARRWRLGEPPDWTNGRARFMKVMTFMGSPRERAFMLVDSPLSFRRRLIFTEAEPLRRARMPKDERFRAYEKLRSGLVLVEDEREDACEAS